MPSKTIAAILATATEVNRALQEFADNGGRVVVIPANMQGFDLILDNGQLRRGQN